MIKWIVPIVLMMSLVLVSCGGGEDSPPKSTSTPVFQSSVGTVDTAKLVEVKEPSKETSRDTSKDGTKASDIKEPTDETAQTVDRDSLFLLLESPSSLEFVANKPALLVKGETRVDALLTVGSDVVEPDVNGIFSHEITLNDGHNIIEILASTSSGEQQGLVLAVIYNP